MTLTPGVVRIGISRCLLGDEVRYDGGHKRHDTVLDVIGPHVEWVSVCPEVEVGMGTPREPIQLVTTPDGVRLLASRHDWTDAMRSWAAGRIRGLQALDLDGYIFKARSPSCGVHGVRGLFAEAVIAALTQLPVAEEEELATTGAAEAFLARARAYRDRRG